MEKVDITVIGAGVIGLAVSYLFSDLGKEIMVIEKNRSFGQETSSRNSEVIHAGIYYPKGSLKSETCIRGGRLLYEFCEKNKIAYKKLGKLIVANETGGISKLETIYKNAGECGVEGLQFLAKSEIRKLEPDVRCEKAIFSPETGIFDTHSFLEFLYKKSKERKVNFAFSVEVIGIERKGGEYKITVSEPHKEKFSFMTECVINAAGLFSDKIAELAGIDADKYSYRINYCKGQYFRIRDPKKFKVHHLIYPPPGEIDLGIHVTPDLAGGLRLGPDAEYVEAIDYNINEKDKNKFLNSLQKFLPNLELNDIIPDTAGIRPKLQSEKESFRDFVISEESTKGFPNFINLIGIESPGLTSALAIAERVKQIWSNIR